MNTLGWIMFLAANLAVIALLVFCFKKVFSLEQEHLHSTLDIDTKDTNGNKDKISHN
jgi:hypothetical protein